MRKKRKPSVATIAKCEAAKDGFFGATVALPQPPDVWSFVE